MILTSTDTGSGFPGLSGSAFQTHYDTIYGGHAWPQGAGLSIIGVEPGDKAAPVGSFGRKDTRHFRVVPITDPAAAWRAVSTFAGRGWSTFMGVGARKPGVTGQGNAGDVLAHSALTVDLDTADGVHRANKASGLPYPTREEVRSWIAELPVAADPLLITTGGGFHLWLPLSRPIDLLSEQGKALHAGWVAWWIGIAARDGRHIDVTPLKNVAAILRPAGSLNTKTDPARPVVIDSAGPRRADVDEALTLFPAPAPVRKPTRPPVTRFPSAAPGVSSPQVVEGAPSRPGDLFNIGVDPGELAVDLFAAQPTGGATFILPHTDGTYGDAHNASTFVGADGLTRLTIHGDAILAEWEAAGADGSVFTSFALLTHYLVTKGAPLERAFGLAAKVATSHRRGDGTYPDLVPALTEVPTAAAIAKAVASDGTSTAAASFLTVLENHENHTFALEHNIIVKLAGAETGVYRTTTQTVPVKGPDGKPVKDDKGNTVTEDIQTEDRLTRWVPWLAATHEIHAIDAAGRTRTTGAVEFYPEIIDQHGRRFQVTEPVTDKDAFDLKKLRGLLHHAAIQLPVQTADRLHLENVISALGAQDGSRDQRVGFNAMGWAYIDGRLTYLASAGSVTATGLVSHVVARPGHRDGQGLPAAMAGIGFDRILTSRQDMRNAAGYIAAFRAIVPDGPAAIALLGAAWTAPLPQDKHTTLTLEGKSGGGKSLLMATTQGIQSGSPSTAMESTANLTQKPSMVGLQARAMWSRHALATWDDHRVGLGHDEEKKALALAVALIQMGVGAEDPARSNTERGIAAARDMSFMGILTCEELPQGGPAVINRTLSVEIKPDDVKIFPRGTSPFDTYLNQYERTGKARALQASYISWLAKRIEAAGSLRAMQTEVSKLKDIFHPEMGERVVVSASVLAVGHAYFRMFAAEMGFADLLPSEAEVDAAILATASATDAQAQDANPAYKILQFLRNRMAQHTGFVSGDGGSTPAKHVSEFGWTLDYRGERYIPRQGALFVGTISADFSHLIIPRATISDVKRIEGIGTANSALDRMFAEWADPESFSKDKPSMRWGLLSRPRGIIVPTAMLVDALDDVPALA